MTVFLYILEFIGYILIVLTFVFLGIGIKKGLDKNRIEDTDFKKVVKVKNYEKFMANYANIMKSLESGEPIDLVEDHEIEEILHDKRENVLKEFYKIFLDVQKALTNSDFKVLKELCTDELYNTYKAQADTLELSNKKTVKNTYELIAEDIIDLYKENDLIIIEVLLKVLYNDYIIKKGATDWMDGEPFSKDEAYKLTFVIGDGKEDVCPNCGAELNTNSSGKCPYCKSYIVSKPNHYTLSNVDVIE